MIVECETGNYEFKGKSGAMSIVVMGVTGCGKTTVGQLLAERLGWTFYDADDFHPEENVEKMRNGQPLSDTDRQPWLYKLNELLLHSEQQDSPVVLACSALKLEYRRILAEQLSQLRLVFLQGDSSLIQQRLTARTGHYMNPVLLKSQFDALEEPSHEENPILCHVGPSPEEIVEEVASQL